MTGNTSSPLHGVHVLVTRPEAQSEPFARLLVTAGATSIMLPAIEIAPLPVDKNRFNFPDKGKQLAIFISQNAVDHALDLFELLPDSTELLAIGNKTAQRMQSLGLNVSLVPHQGFTSEALLALPEMQSLADAHVTIFRGKGGRTLLSEELTKRGASVSCIDLYQRELPQYTPATLRHRLIDATPQVVTITSVETLRNFLTITDKLPPFNARDLPVIAGSSRIGAAVRETGFTAAPWIASDPTDESMLQALLQWKENEIALP